jgi:hypothetical protein
MYIARNPGAVPAPPDNAARVSRCIMRLTLDHQNLNRAPTS